MRHLFKRTVRTAVHMGLIDLAVQAVDGTKIAGNASKSRSYDAVQLQRLLEKTEAAIQDLELQNEAGADPPAPHLPKELADKQRLLAQVKGALERLEAEEGKKRINLTDGDTGFLKARHQQMIAGYNMEAMVSPVKAPETKVTAETAGGKTEREVVSLVKAPENKATGRIITRLRRIDVIAGQNDVGELIPMMEQSEQNTGKRAEVSLADANFHSGPNLEACAQREQVVVMPDPHEKDLEKPYHKDHFVYDANSDSYTCPQGQTLHFKRMGHYRNTPVRVYSASGAICCGCPAFGTCTVDRSNGRRLEIGPHDSFLRYHREWMLTQKAKDLYQKRKELPEPVFGIIKEQQGARRFLLRGLTNVRAEATLLATTFNMRTICSMWRKGVVSLVQWVGVRLGRMAQACGSIRSAVGGWPGKQEPKTAGRSGDVSEPGPILRETPALLMAHA